MSSFYKYLEMASYTDTELSIEDFIVEKIENKIWIDDNRTGNSGELIIGHGSFGKDESRPYVSHIEWESDLSSEEAEQIENFIEYNLSHYIPTIDVPNDRTNLDRR